MEEKARLTVKAPAILNMISTAVSNLRKYRPSKAKRKSLTVYFTPDGYKQFRALADSQALFYGELAELLLREYL